MMQLSITRTHTGNKDTLNAGVIIFCVWARERLTLCFVCSDQYWVKGTWAVCLRKRQCVVCPFLIGLCDNILVTQRPWRTTVFHAPTSTDNTRMMNSWIREFPQDSMNSDFLHIAHRAQRKCLCVCVWVCCSPVGPLIEWIWMPMD